jgi:NADH dehydrogenase [ubiquinone] 1 alpha subcomplex assembly factor 7
VGGGSVFLLVCILASRRSQAVNALKEKILKLIRAQGPISVAQYMHMALMDSEHGYYMGRDPFGSCGDFITAPEVSQIFGEMIGLFFVAAWEDRGAPKRFHLAELGPGRGTLMADILRAGQIRPGFAQSAQVTLIEASPALRAVQERTLKDRRVSWAEGLDDLTGAPVFVIANEFLDALPVHQFVKSAKGWHARIVAAEGEELVFATSKECAPVSSFPAHPAARLGAIVEVGTEAVAAMQTIADRVASSGGVALILDYGHTEPGLGDTFQAVKRHAYADPLAEPGEADLTFHVDFAALADTARQADAYVFGPITQGEFLCALGIGARAERLNRAAPGSAAEIDVAVDRLTNPKQMGTLFKVMGICDGVFPGLPGFPC